MWTFGFCRSRYFNFPSYRYGDVESESDDEVDLKELAKAIKKYQTLNGWYSSFYRFTLISEILLKKSN